MMSLNTTVQNLYNDKGNALFLLRNSLTSLSIAVDNLVNPILKISEEARKHLTFNQNIAIENAFSLRTVGLKKQLALIKEQLALPEDKIYSNLDIIRLQLQNLRDEYLRSEMVFGYYVDLLHTRAIKDIGMVLRGYDNLARATLKIFLSPLRYHIPWVVVYLEQIGDGAAIMRADISLWDRMKNPCAVIKMPQSNLCFPRSSIFHEAGHQVASITGFNQEGANLLYDTIINAGGSVSLASYWKYCAKEIVADQIATHLTNFIGSTTLYSIYSGSVGRMFAIIPKDTHLMGYLRICSNIESCKLAFGSGPWDTLKRAMDLLYAIRLAPPFSARVINESIPILPTICKALSKTRLSCFGGRSLEEIAPMRCVSLTLVRKLLNFDLSNFSTSMKAMVQNPILTLIAFGVLHMLGRKSLYWVTDGMGKWLSALGEKEL